MAKAITSEAPSINILTTGTSLKGEIMADGDFRIDGTLNGSINCKGKVVIGTTGKVEGEILCGNIDISGNVEGKITVAELLSLKSTAQVRGDIIVTKLSIEPGAVFSGSCKMDGNVRKESGVRKDEAPRAEKTVQ